MTKLHAPTDSKERKGLPVCTGVLDYFPDALLAVAELSRKGNDKHNPGLPLQWSKHLSNDHADCILRHMIDRGTIDPEDNVRHSTKVAWRALALLQIEIETERAKGEVVKIEPVKVLPPIEQRVPCPDLDQTPRVVPRYPEQLAPINQFDVRKPGENFTQAYERIERDSRASCSLCGRPECASVEAIELALTVAADLSDKVWPAS
jgi:hypothetical protein